MERLRTGVGERCRAYVQALYQEVDTDICTGRPPRHPKLAAGISTRELTDATEDELQVLNETLNDIWKSDGWESRLEPFIDRLGVDQDALRALRWLVGRGCQPDILAEGFYRAVVPKSTPTAIAASVDKQEQTLAARLSEAADFTEELVRYVVGHGFSTRVRSDLPSTLRDMAESIRPATARVASESGRRQVRLLDALTHIEKVVGKPRHHDAMLIFNALRAEAGQPQIETDTLKKIVQRARRHRRALRDTLEAHLSDDSKREIADVVDTWGICNREASDTI